MGGIKTRLVVDTIILNLDAGPDMALDPGMSWCGAANVGLKWKAVSEHFIDEKAPGDIESINLSIINFGATATSFSTMKHALRVPTCSGAERGNYPSTSQTIRIARCDPI